MDAAGETRSALDVARPLGAAAGVDRNDFYVGESGVLGESRRKEEERGGEGGEGMHFDQSEVGWVEWDSNRAIGSTEDGSESEI